MVDYIIILVRWSYVPSGRATSRNIPSETRRILMGPIASGPKHYPWVLEKGLEKFLQPYVFALVKPKGYKKGRGRVGPAEGAIAIFKIREKISNTDLAKIIDKLVQFCDEWKEVGKYGTKITSYQIITSNLLVYK